MRKSILNSFPVDICSLEKNFLRFKYLENWLDASTVCVCASVGACLSEERERVKEIGFIGVFNKTSLVFL